MDNSKAVYCNAMWGVKARIRPHTVRTATDARLAGIGGPGMLPRVPRAVCEQDADDEKRVEARLH